MDKFIFFPLVAVLMSALPVMANDITRKIPVDNRFVEDKLTFTGGIGGGYTMKTRVLVVNGIIEFCGVGAYTNAQFRGAVRAHLRKTELALNGQPILRDMRFFSAAARPSKINATMANCKSTGTRMPAKVDSLRLRASTTRFSN